MSAYKFMILGALLSLQLFTALTSAANIKDIIDEEHEKCESGSDDMACVKVRAMKFIDTVISKDNYKISDIAVQSNGYQTSAESSRSEKNDFFDIVEQYLQGHDITMDLPLAEAKVTVSSRNLAQDELNFTVNFAGDSDVVEGKGKKKRLRKLAMPIMVLILLKAITVIPMAIGILKIKALNALGLGFLSFIVSVGLAIFQLCKKIASSEHHTAHITAHGPWDGRSLNPKLQLEQYEIIPAAHNLAYNAYI
uniref:Uncharacterized protein n=1 Tax=Glossina morsitans morsitans TaxID=37546 RepID=A0A1B0FLD1_GLOMM